jgi:hypothetical protein
MSEVNSGNRIPASLEQGRIRLFCCGGAGINIGSYFNTRISNVGYASIATSYVDTSKSNLIKAGITDESIVELLPSVDGSGKIRSENAAAISDSIKQLLLRQKPEHFNIVLFSASGGSGSVSGPLIVSELLARDEAVLALVIGSEESLLTAENTIKTLKTLDAISNKHNKPVVMYYVHNVQGQARSEADAEMRETVSSIAVLASRQNAEMDSRDVANWLGYHRATSVKPQLSLLTIVNSPAAAADITLPVSIASLYRNEKSPTLTVTPDYVTAGYLPETAKVETDLHYVISCDNVNSIASNIQTRLDSMKEKTGSRSAQTGLVSASDKVESNGLVL